MDDRYRELFEKLRDERFPVGPDQYLRMHQLLRALPEASPERLRTLLAPIFAQSPEQQTRFYDVYDALFAARPAEAEPETAPAPLPVRRTTIWVAILAALLIAGLYAALRSDRDANPPVTHTNPQPPVERTKFVEEKEKITERSPAVTPRMIAEVALVAVLVAIVVALAIQEWRRRRKRPDDAEGPPYEWSPRSTGQQGTFDATELLRLARAMKGREEGTPRRLHLIKTILATARAGGDPQLVYRHTLQAPEYVVLIERRSDRDHQAAWFEGLVTALASEGVAVTRYWFEEDPRTVWSESRNTRVRLRDVHHRSPDARLLICADAEVLLDPVTGDVHEGIAAEMEWKKQFVVTPAAVRPAVAEKLQRNAGIISGADTLAQLTERLTGATPRAGVAPNATLSADAKRLLRATATYPQLEWPVTLALGHELLDGRLAAALRELISLPSFRRGVLRSSERAALLEELASDPELERTARAVVKRVLRETELPPGSFAARERDLQLVGQEVFLQRTSASALATLYAELRAFRVAEIGRDAALLRLVASAPGTRVLRHIPHRVRRLWFRSGIPALGHHDLTGAAVGAIVAIVLLAATPWSRFETASGAPVEREVSRWVEKVVTETTGTTPAAQTQTVPNPEPSTPTPTNPPADDPTPTPAPERPAPDVVADLPVNAPEQTTAPSSGAPECIAVLTFNDAPNPKEPDDATIDFSNCSTPPPENPDQFEILRMTGPSSTNICGAQVLSMQGTQANVRVNCQMMRFPSGVHQLRWQKRTWELVVQNRDAAPSRQLVYVSPQQDQVFLASSPILFEWTPEGEHTLAITGRSGTERIPVSGSTHTWATRATGTFEWSLHSIEAPETRRFHIVRSDLRDVVNIPITIRYVCGQSYSGMVEIPMTLPDDVAVEPKRSVISGSGLEILEMHRFEAVDRARIRLVYEINAPACTGENNLAATAHIALQRPSNGPAHF